MLSYIIRNSRPGVASCISINTQDTGMVGTAQNFLHLPVGTKRTNVRTSLSEL